MQKNFPIVTRRVERSKTGLPTLAEEGGGATNTGSATVICGPEGEKLVPLFVPKGSSNGTHATFVVGVGMHILEGNFDRWGEKIRILQINKIGTEGDPDSIECHEVYGYEDGDGNIPDRFKEAFEAVKVKMRCYHCRSAHYVAV